MNQKTLLIGAVIIIIVVVGAVLVAGQSQTQRQATNEESQSSTAFTVGQKAPDFTLKDFEGNEVKLSDFYGQKAMVLDFWAAWCPFCVDELPELERTHQAYKDNLVMIGVHRTDSGETIEQGKVFADAQGVTYLLVQGTSEMYRAATKGLNAMPVAIFIDKNGIVRDIKHGPKTESEIKEKVSTLVQ